MEKIMVQSIDDDWEYMKKISDNENNKEVADDNDEGEGNGDESVVMTAKNVTTVRKKVTVKRLTIMMVGVIKMKKC
jgi:hypothetical protein